MIIDQCKIVVINLKKDIDRKMFMSKQLESFNLNYEFFDAVDGKLFDFSKMNVDKNMTDGEKGCALSHKFVLSNFLEGKHEYCLVLEDDVGLPLNFNKILEKHLNDRKLLKESWEYLSLNYPSVGLKFIHLWLFLLNRLFRDKLSLTLFLKIPIFFIKFFFVISISFFEGLREKFYKILFPLGKSSIFFRPLYLTGCYLINRSGAIKLLNLQNDLIYTSDRLPNIAKIKNKLKFRAIVPLFVKQKRDKFESNIMINDKYFFNN